MISATSLSPSSSPAPAPSPRQLMVAATLLTRLANAEFDELGELFEPELNALAMLPAGVFEWPDPGTIRAVFNQWFGDVDHYEIVDFAVGLVGPRMHARWRVSVAGGHLGDGWYVVDQQIYADTTAAGRIRSMSFMCSGFVRVASDG